MEGPIDWFISSPKEEFVVNLANGILKQGFLAIWNAKLMVEAVEVMKPPPFEPRMSLRTLSPIVVSTGQVHNNGSFHKKYLRPEEPEFNPILEENLRRKHLACYGKNPCEEGVSLELLRTPQSKLIDYKGIKVRGWFMHFRVSGAPDLIRIGYEAGCGENNSAGFGMVEVTG